MRRLFPLMLLCLCLPILFHQAASASSRQSDQYSTAAFNANAGQIYDDAGHARPDVLFRSRGAQSEMYLRRSGFSYVFTSYERDNPDDRSPIDLTHLTEENDVMVTRYRMDMEFIGADPTAVVDGVGVVAGIENYYRGPVENAVLGVHSYREVLYRNVYPNIDLRVYFSGQGLKYDFLVWPGGNPADIRLKYDGATDIRLNETGEMVLQNPHGILLEERPYTWQRSGTDDLSAESDAKNRSTVRSAFHLDGEEVSFEIGEYDRKKLLVIDPGVVWGTYYGGVGADSFEDVFAHDNGNVFVAGTTSSFDFPTTPGIDKQSSLAGSSDAMVVLFDKDRERVWATYFGGAKLDRLAGIWVNEIGSAHLIGSTTSTDFPLKLAFQDELINDESAAFVSQLNATEGIIRWSTYFGGGNRDEGIDITGSDGHLIICGTTGEKGALFPLKGEYKGSKGDFETDMFLARIQNGGAPLWSTFFGGTDDDYATGVTIDSKNNITLVGWTRSDDIKDTDNSYQPDNAGGIDGVVAKFSPTGNPLWISYLGTAGRDLAMDVQALPNNDNIMVFGDTHHTSFPTFNGFQNTPNNVTDDPAFADMFLFEFTPSGQRAWASLYGGDSTDRAFKLAAYEDGGILLCGQTDSDIFPLSDDAWRKDAEDTLAAAVVAKVSASRELIYSTYLFDDKLDFAYSVAAVGPSAEDGNMIVVGAYQSDRMPVAKEFQDFVKGGTEGYIWEYGCATFTEIEADGPLEFCEGGSVILDAGDGFDDYTWNTGAKTQTIEVTESGDYFVTVIEGGDCDFTTPPTAVSVFPIPEPVISADGPTELCNGESVTLDAGAGYESYKWSNDAETQTITVDQTDEYFVVVTGEGGCEAETSIEVNVRPTPQLTAEPAELDWGILDGCQSSVTLPLTLTNTNGFPVRLTALEFSNADEFGATNFTPGVQVESGANTVINIVFTPATLNNVDAELRIKISPCDTEIVIPLKGGKGELLLSATPSTMDFGNALLCGDSSQKDSVIVFRNSGDEDIVLQSAQFNAPFSVVGNPFPLTIPPSETADLTVRFAPATAGPANTELSVRYTSGSCDDNVRFALSGTGRDAEVTLLNGNALQFPRVGGCDDFSDAELLLEVSAGAVGPIRIVDAQEAGGQISTQDATPFDLAVADVVRLPLRFTPGMEGVISGTGTITYELDGCTKTVEFDFEGEKRGISIVVPDQVDFGTYFSCQEESRTERITIQHSGEPAVVERIQIEGDFATTLLEGEDVPDFFDIIFATNQTDATGSMTIRFQPCGIERTIQLTGRRVDLSLDGPAAEDFGTVQPAASDTRTITWTNDGTGTVEVTALDCLLEPFTLVSPTNFPIEVAPGEDLQIVVEFSPTAAGDFTGELCVRIPDPCNLTFRTALNGTGDEDVVLPGTVDIYIPDLTANPKWSEFDIPIIVRSVDGFGDNPTVSATAYVSMNASVFFPQSLSAGAIAANTKNLGVRQLVLQTGEITLMAGEPMTVIRGVPLLGDAVTSALLLDSVVFSGRDVDATLEDGSLTLDSLCEAGGTRLLTSTTSFGIRGIQPNPSDGAADISFQPLEGALNVIELYSPTGQVIVRRELDVPAGDGGRARQLLLPDDLPAGVYTLTVRAEFLRDSRRVVIVR